MGGTAAMWRAECLSERQEQALVSGFRRARGRIYERIQQQFAQTPKANQSHRSRLIPHTYAMEGLRLVLLSGHGFHDTTVRNDLIVMLCFATFSMALGIFTLNRALNRAANGNGVGTVV